MRTSSCRTPETRASSRRWPDPSRRSDRRDCLARARSGRRSSFHPATNSLRPRVALRPSAAARAKESHAPGTWLLPPGPRGRRPRAFEIEQSSGSLYHALSDTLDRTKNDIVFGLKIKCHVTEQLFVSDVYVCISRNYHGNVSAICIYMEQTGHDRSDLVQPPLAANYPKINNLAALPAD